MKTEINDRGQEVLTYTWFEICVGRMFFETQGSTTEALHHQQWWADIQRLKRLAQQERQPAIDALLEACHDIVIEWHHPEDEWVGPQLDHRIKWLDRAMQNLRETGSRTHTEAPGATYRE